MSALGLESLIPKKRGAVEKPLSEAAVVPPSLDGEPFGELRAVSPSVLRTSGSKDLSNPLGTVEPQRGGTPLEDSTELNRTSSRPRSSDVPSAVGGRARLGSETLPQVVSPPHRDRKASEGSESIFHIEVHLIKPNPFQPRREFSEAGIEELARSIRDFGILQPLVVSKVVRETESGAEVTYELIAGERRLLAAKKLGLERVPVVVKRVDENRAKLEMSLIENLQRSDLSALEMARAYARLQDEFGLTQREVAARVGKSREVVANALRLLGLPQEIQRALGTGAINESQARALLAIGNALEQERVLQEFLSRGGAVRARREKTPPPPADPEGAFWERRLEEKLGAPVRVIKKGNRGKIEMRFHSEEEWHGLVERLVGRGEVE